MNSFQKKLLIGLVVMAVVSPIGIKLPELMKAGEAWGEWSKDKIKEMIGYVPAGMEKDSEIWKAPIPDYNLGDEKSTFMVQALSYMLSGAIGIIVCGGLLYLLSRLLVKKNE
ncbi:MAG: cobalamin biosynthesis protein [Spirochaetes bacterium]|jgi:hypothetical protein|nr:cobalamin biosynthesis protein [Spirochaetota bacterium]